MPDRRRQPHARVRELTAGLRTVAAARAKSRSCVAHSPLRSRADTLYTFSRFRSNKPLNQKHRPARTGPPTCHVPTARRTASARPTPHGAARRRPGSAHRARTRHATTTAGPADGFQGGAGRPVGGNPYPRGSGSASPAELASGGAGGAPTAQATQPDLDVRVVACRHDALNPHSTYYTRESRYGSRLARSIHAP